MNDLQRELDVMAGEFAATLGRVGSMRCGQVHRTGFGGELTVAHVTYAIDAEVAVVLAGMATAETVVLTQDGRHANYGEWHTGATDIDTWVYYERWHRWHGRVGHGYVDVVTRKVVQTG